MNLEQLKAEMPMRITIKDAAEILEMTPESVREGIKQNVFPFGVPIQMRQCESYIFTKRFIAYVEAYDMVGLERKWK